MQKRVWIHQTNSYNSTTQFTCRPTFPAVTYVLRSVKFVSTELARGVLAFTGKCFLLAHMLMRYFLNPFC